MNQKMSDDPINQTQLAERIRPPALSLGLLIHLVHQHKDRLLTKNFVELDITPAQFKVLSAIGYGEFHSPADISKAVSIDGGSMSRMFNRLENKNLIVRTPNPNDKRSVWLYLTEEGKEVLEKCYQLTVTKVNDELIGDLSSEEVELLFSLLKRLIPESCSVNDLIR